MSATTPSPIPISASCRTRWSRSKSTPHSVCSRRSPDGRCDCSGRPIFGDAEPTTADEIVPIGIAQGMGYLSVGLHVDPNDWENPTADQIVSRVIEQVSDPNPDVRGHVILLHDSGGDRSQTVAALPKLIDTLRAKGYELVPVSELAGMTRDQAMPPIPPKSLARMVGLPVFMTLSWLGKLAATLFFAAICLGVLQAPVSLRRVAAQPPARIAPRPARAARRSAAAIRADPGP